MPTSQQPALVGAWLFFLQPVALGDKAHRSFRASGRATPQLKRRIFPNVEVAWSHRVSAEPVGACARCAGAAACPSQAQIPSAVQGRGFGIYRPSCHRRIANGIVRSRHRVRRPCSARWKIFCSDALVQAKIAQDTSANGSFATEPAGFASQSMSASLRKRPKRCFAAK